jgi:Ion channel.
MQAIPDLRTAFYLVGETYTSLGNGDVLLPLGWRQLAMFITMSGLLTFGWTTGVLANIVGKTYDAQFASVRDKPTVPSSGKGEDSVED